MEDWPGKKRILVYAGAFSLALLCGLLASYFYEQGAFRGQVLRGVVLQGHSVFGLDRSELVSFLGPLERDVDEQEIELTLKGETRKFRAGDLGVAVDVDAITRRALGAGHQGSVFSRFGYWLGSLISSEEVPLTLRTDQTKLKKVLGTWAKELLDEPVLPSVTFDGELHVTMGRGGTVIEYEELARSLQAGGRPKEGWKKIIPTRERPPIVPEDDVVRVRREAETLVKKPIELVAPGAEGGGVILSPFALGAALGNRIDEKNGTFTLQIDLEILKKSMAKLLREVEREPIDASFQFSSTGVPTMTPSEDGRGLDEAAFQRALREVGADGPRRIVLPLQVRKPKLTTEEAEKLGVKGLVMSFTTRHACCQPRVENIHHAAGQLDGVILRPGEKFSLNEFLGPRRKSTGYRKAPTIVRGEMEDVYGGGISQLATTLFNAVLRGGYEIIQRQPHSVYFSRYPEGHEATVSFPEPDLIFRNDTEAGMVIKTRAESTYIRVLIFGDNGGRVTTVDKGQRYDIVEPPKEYEPDETMPPEKMKRLRAGQLGWTVLVSRKVKYPSGKVKEEKREVVYNARPELLRVHPCVIPEGVEGHTGEKCPEPEIVEEEEELSEDVYFETL